MKRNATQLMVVMIFLVLFSPLLQAQNSGKSPNEWAIVASYTVPGKASGLAWDGTFLYFGIYGANGQNIYKFNPANGSYSLQCSGTFGDAYGLTYKSPDLVTVDQPSNSSQPSSILEFNLSGGNVSTLTLPDHYMSGVAYDNGNWWVCTYYPDPGIVYHLNASGAVLSQFTPPANQPWDICKQGNDLWIADYYGNTLYKVTTTGTVIESHPSTGQNPSGVVYDGTYLWYCDGPLGGNSTLYKIDLTGAGTPVINVPVTMHNYGNVAIGSNATWNCQVQNTGSANLTITGIGIIPGQPITTTFTTPQTITPGGSVNIPLRFTPVSAVPLNTQVSIQSSDPVHPIVNLTLTGNGVYPNPHISLPATYYDYGTRRAGAYSRWKLPVTNTGNQNLIISNLNIDNEHFTVDESVNLPITITPLATTEIGLWFHPTESADYSATLTIASNATGQELLYFSLNGTGELTTYPIGTPLWTYSISDGFDNSPKSIMPISDVTGDGISDVIVGSEDYYIRCFNGNASVTGDVIWEKFITSGPVYQQNCISIIQDINNDGFEDVIAGTAGGDESIIALSGKTGQQLWKHSTHEYGGGGWLYQVDSRYDFNGDGADDVLAATGNDGNNTGPVRVYCLNGLNGISLWEYYVGGPVFSVIGVDDFTGDGLPDVVAGASNQGETQGRTIGLNGTNGQLKWNYTNQGSSVWGLMQLDDITGDGIKDIAAGDFSGYLVYLNAANGLPVHQVSIGAVIILRLVDIDDANKNGYRDVLVAHSGFNARVIDGSTCTSIWSQPLSDKSWCVANAGDITWDGTSDAAIGTLYQNNNAYFLNGVNGSILSTTPAMAAVDALNTIPDITGDHSMEMLFGDRDGLLTCISGGYDSTQVAVNQRPAPALDLIIYPNPNNGRFRVVAGSTTQVSANFRMLDLQGRVIQEFPACWLASGTTTIEMSVGRAIQPGVYVFEAITTQGRVERKLMIQQ